MNIPQRIRIGAMDFDVVIAPKSGATLEPTYCGMIEQASQTITILDGCGEQQKQLVVLHECIHGILFSAGYKDHDEKMVEALAHGLYMLQRDNPELFKPENGGEDDGEKEQGQGQG